MWFSGWTRKSNRYFGNFFTKVQQIPPKAYAINCSYYATGTQNTTYKQRKRERTKRNHPWPHFLVIQNSPVQFFPFPVYPGWQSHTCDPMVLRQFAFSWQEWFPLHSSTSMKSEIKKMRFQNYPKKGLSYAITELKSASHGCFQLFAELREREIVVHEKKVIYVKSYHVITFSRLTTT